MGDREDRFADLLAALGSERRPPGRGVGTVQEEEVPLGRHRGRGKEPVEPGRRTRLVTLPVALRSAQVRVGRSAVWGMVLVIVLVAAVLGVRVAWAERQAVPEPLPAQPVPSGELVEQGDGAPPITGTDHAVASSAPPAQPPPDLVVHVIGAVDAPGVVPVPAGARVQDAVDRDGGIGGQADLSRINLARAVLDGERIWVPVQGEEAPEDVTAPPGVPAVVPGVTGSGGAAGGPAEDAGPLVDLNTADAAALDTLPGVGPVTAEAILGWRTDHGSFTSVEELLEVSGIGDRTLEDLRPHVTVAP